MSNKSKSFAIIAAVCHNNGIGFEGRLPWRLKDEMSYFTRITSSAAEGKQNAVIMGRNTWESIPPKFRPLPNRVNVVLSKTLDQLPNGAHFLFRSFSQSMDEMSKNENIDKIFVIGGQEVYKEAIDCIECQFIYLTKIYQNFICDSFFPEVNLKQYEDITREDKAIPQLQQQENDIKYQYFLYKRLND